MSHGSTPLSSTLARPATYVIFTLSGFSGLIYESIWSHYLKLMLGHAAYAQTLVLALFMGGMALGAWIAGSASARIRRPLLAYAAIELVIGCLGFGFDPVFRSTLTFLLETAAPALGSPIPIEALKWTLASLLILPCCMLLGATFPLISAAVVRWSPGDAGNSLAWLYFTNSLGGVIGVLLSGFVLVSAVGLPGTLLTAAICNILLATVTYLLGRAAPSPAGLPSASHATADRVAPLGTLLMATAFFTGAASFFYEIGWIRMLSLVLGSATHSFELMLAAFILGLALGALWIRNRIDGIQRPLRALAWVQVLMGTLALCTLVAYGWSFDAMAAIVSTVQRTETGYAWFNVASLSLCMVLMIPTTFLAGMTLPLITTLAIRSRHGEAGIGRIYSANTFGAIAGIILSVHVAMPLLGLRNVIVSGAVIDIALGMWLFARSEIVGGWRERVVLGLAVAVAISIAVTVRFDVHQMSSGVYRFAIARKQDEVLFHRDGRTASIDVTKHKTGQLSILTNGKSDASLFPDRASVDDYTMLLTGILPLALRPDASEVAVIGLGSGRSTHTLLASPNVLNVDTVEIEPVMAEGARLFGPLVDRTFQDPRSKIHFEDAKTFFARHRKQYDIVMSEPSNPWVSGVASLFTEEFYRQVKAYVKPGGIFVQWLQLYEFDDTLVATIGTALGTQFSDYAFYFTNSADLIIVATAEGKVGMPDTKVLEWEDIRPLAESIQVRTQADLAVRWLGDRALLAPWFAAKRQPPNSDYFPILDQSAAKYRFMATTAFGLPQASPVLLRMEDRSLRFRDLTPASWQPMQRAIGGAQFADYLEWRHGEGVSKGPKDVTSTVVARATLLGQTRRRCEQLEFRSVWKPTLQEMALEYWAYLDPADARRITSVLRHHVCTGEEKATLDLWLDFLDADTAGRWEEVQSLALQILMSDPDRPSAFLFREMLLADYRLFGIGGLATRFQQFANIIPDDPSIQFLRTIATP